MCGLAGVVGQYLTDKEVDVFRQLLIVSSLRGPHSTGIITATKEKYDQPIQVNTFKEVGDPFVVLQCSNFEKIMKHSSRKLLFGHCRWATKGKVTVENAHPFTAGHIVGMHNGTINNEFDKSKDFETDSEAIFNNIAEKGLKDTLQHLEDEGHPAYALIYYDTEKNTANIIRNSSRPLYYAHNNSGSVMFFASEKDMLSLVLDRNYIYYKDIHSLRTNIHVEIPLTSTKPLDDWNIHEKIVTPKPYVSKVTEYIGYGYHSHQGHNQVGKKKETIGVIGNNPLTKASPAPNNGLPALPAPDPNGNKVFPQGRTYKGYKGHWMARTDAQVILNDGCSWCTRQSSLTDPVRWFGPKEYLCEDCKDNQQIAEFVGNLADITNDETKDVVEYIQ